MERLYSLYSSTKYEVKYAYRLNMSFYNLYVYLCKRHADLTLPHCMMYQIPLLTVSGREKVIYVAMPTISANKQYLVRTTLIPFDTLFLLLSFLVHFVPLEELGMDSC